MRATKTKTENVHFQVGGDFSQALCNDIGDGWGPGPGKCTFDLPSVTCPDCLKRLRSAGKKKRKGT